MRISVRRRVASLICALSLLLVSVPAGAECVPDYAANGEQAVVGYYGGWASDMGFGPEKLPYRLLTHVIYAFADIDPTTGGAYLPYAARDGKNLAALVKMREKYPHIKLLISVGGWDYSKHFSHIAATPQSRQRFAASCAELVKNYDLDGIDIDWEYPVSGGPAGAAHRTEDRENFTRLLAAIRAELNKLSDTRRYYLTAAVGAESGYLKKIEPAKAADIVDFFFVMAYDYHGAWDRYADFNAPLYTPKDDTKQFSGSADETVRGFIKSGVSPRKLVLGIPLYGKKYSGVPSGNNGLYGTYSTVKAVTYDELKTSYLPNRNYKKLTHKTACLPYLYGGGTFISYDDASSAGAKGKYARDNGLGGVGFWELSQNRNSEVLTAACAAMTGEVFSDVLPDAWYFDSVCYAYQNGLMSGTGGGKFSPEAPVERGMLAAVLYRKEGSPQVSGELFRDVSPSSYYADAVRWAAENSIMVGTGNGKFSPEEKLTREQLAAVIYRYMIYNNADITAKADLPDFKDNDRISPYAAEAMSWAVSAGLIKGTGNGLLSPAGTAARAQLGAVLMRTGQMM